MGKIYNDVEKVNNPEVNDMIENIVSVGSFVEGADYIKYRDNEINRIYNIMSKVDSRAVLLVGDFGSGKRSIIEGYVDKLEKNIKKDKVIEIDFNEIQED